jgi:mannitol/fructose-specific phosphotransferase system IIA component (Ntr-type)
MFISLKTAIDYDAPDNKPIDLLFALLLPKDDKNSDIWSNSLADIIAILSDKSNIKTLCNTNDKQIIIDTFYEK